MKLMCFHLMSYTELPDATIKLEWCEPLCSFMYPLPGLAPGIHVLAAGIAKAQEDVDGRVKPSQGDLW